MRKFLGMALVIGLAAGVVTSASAERYIETCLLAESVPYACPPKLEFDLGATIVPRRLPRQEMAPVALRLDGTVTHDDQSQPVALREMILDIDEDLSLNVGGLPVCKGSLLRIRNVKAARNACRQSIVGEGRAHIAITPTSEPIPTTVTLFNGGTNGGKQLIYVHSFLDASLSASLVGIVMVSREDDGLHTITRIPPIADGNGSILDFHVTIRRLFAHGDEETSYLEAKCPDNVFKINAPKILFKNEARTPSVAATTVFAGGISVPCTPSHAGRR